MLSISTVVGGHTKHYNNLNRCLRSLERLNRPYNVYITEFGNHLSSSGNIFVQNKSAALFKTGCFIDHILWKAKYESMLNCPLDDHILYLDSDTVIVNDTIDQLITQTNGLFGCTQHFWTPTCNDFIGKTQPKDPAALIQAIHDMGATHDFPIYAGGVFFFLNSPTNQATLKEVLEIHDRFYPKEDSPFIDRFTDEVITSYVLHKNKGAAPLCGALNHCVMAEMPLEVQNGVLYGRNPFESSWEKVTCGHCDTFRRNPYDCWPEPVRSLVKEAFYL